MTHFLLFNIGCIECGVGSAIVGVFEHEAEAQAHAERLSETHHWRDGGQNAFEVFPLPETLGVTAEEYAP